MARRGGVDSVREFVDGQIIVAEGDVSNEMFIVSSGRVRIVKVGPRGPVVLGHIERGEFFGEMALLESLPRHAAAYAVGATRLLVIEPGSLLVRIRRDPTFALEMLHRLSGRLREANMRLLAPQQTSDPDADDTPIWEIGRPVDGSPP